MAAFPHLNSGAICQYPAQVVHQQAVQVLRYIDGSDQRFLRQGRQFRKWEIRLDSLDETELFNLETFFRQQMGDYSLFTFPDPFSGVLVPNCCLGNSSMVSDLLGVGRCATSFWVVETNV